MKLHTFSVLITFLLFGCTAPSPSTKDPSKEIELQDIESLQLGMTTSAQVRNRFGTPDRIFDYSQQEEIWLYGDSNLSIDKSTQRVFTATWVPPLSSPLLKQDNAVKHFIGKRFTGRDIGWIARHAYSHEAIYENNDRTISIMVNKLNKSVSSISFGMAEKPTVARKN